jgi:hypothetical protein
MNQCSVLVNKVDEGLCPCVTLDLVNSKPYIFPNYLLVNGCQRLH